MILRCFHVQAFTLREHRLLFEEGPETAKPAAQPEVEKDQKEGVNTQPETKDKEDVKAAGAERLNNAQTVLNQAQNFAQDAYKQSTAFMKQHNVAPLADAALRPLVGPAGMKAGEVMAKGADAVLSDKNGNPPEKQVAVVGVPPGPKAPAENAAPKPLPTTPEGIAKRNKELQDEFQKNQKALENQKLPAEERQKLEERQKQIGEEVDALNPPKTNGEKIMRDFNKSMAEAKTFTDKLVAVFALISQLYANILKWNQKIEPEEKKAQAAALNIAETPETRIDAKLKANEKNPDGTVKDQKANLTEIKEKNTTERESNKKKSDDLTVRIEKATKEKNRLIDEKAGLEKQLGGAKDDDKKGIQDQIQRVGEQMAIQEKEIALTPERDALIKKNEDLDKEDKIIDQRLGVKPEEKPADKKPEDEKEEKPAEKPGESPDMQALRIDIFRRGVKNVRTQWMQKKVEAGIALNGGRLPGSARGLLRQKEEVQKGIPADTATTVEELDMMIAAQQKIYDEADQKVKMIDQITGADKTGQKETPEQLADRIAKEPLEGLIARYHTMSDAERQVFLNSPLMQEDQFKKLSAEDAHAFQSFRELSVEKQQELLKKLLVTQKEKSDVQKNGINEVPKEPAEKKPEENKTEDEKSKKKALKQK